MPYTQNTAHFDHSSIDFADAGQALASAERLFRAAEAAGVANRALASSVRRAAGEWILAVEQSVDSMSAADALEIVAVFETVHRIAHGVSANPDFVNRYTLRAFEARIRDDRRVNPYTLFRLIGQGIQRRDPVYFDRPLQWYSLSLDRWHREFASGVSRRPLSDYDTAQRVTILLQSDLWPYETRNEAAYKRRLLAAHRHLLAAPQRNFR